jgi:hypothetical protein
VKLRYTGTRPVTLMTLGIEVEPGGEFEIADGAGGAFEDRPDFERLDAPEEPAAPASDSGDTAPQGTGRRKNTKAASGDPAETQHIDESAPTA